MRIRTAVASLLLVGVGTVAPAAAADLGGYDAAEPTYEDRYAYNTRYDAEPYRYRASRRWRSRGPRRVREFDRLRYDLEDAGYTRIAYHDERRDDYNDTVYYLTACQNGVRYRMHVTADCEIELKRRAGYCRTAFY